MYVDQNHTQNHQSPPDSHCEPHNSSQSNGLPLLLLSSSFILRSLTSDNDVVDGDMDQLDEESNESHDAEPDSCCHGDLSKLFPVRFSTSFDQSAAVLSELLGGV